LTDPERVGNIIAGPPCRPLKGRKGKLELLKVNWRSIAGEEECRHSSPTRLSRRTLTVSADGPSWAAELSVKTHALLRGVEALLGKEEVQKIKVRAGSARQTSEESGVKPAGGKVDRGDLESVELSSDVRGELQSVGHEKTRTALERMLKASVASEQDKRSAS